MLTPAAGQTAWLIDVPPDQMRRIVDALYRAHRLVNSITDLDAVLENLVEESKLVASAEASSLILYDQAADDLFFHVALGEQGNQDALKENLRLKLGEGIAGACAQSRETINVQNVRDDPRFFRGADSISSFTTTSILAVPLIDKDRLVGVLEVINKIGGGGFSTVDERIMEVYSSLAATVIANARLIEANLRSERLSAIGQTVAGLSHHTKNVIAGMRGSIELIDAGLDRGDMTIFQRGWIILKRSVERLSHVVEDMLSYSKSRTPHRAPCDLHTIINDVLEGYDSLIADKNIAVDVHIEPLQEVPRLDERGIHHCMLNLLGNAIDAVPDTGGRILIRVTATMPHDLTIQVADNGPGVPPSHQKNVFEPFFSTKGSSGTGLGLAVTYKIVTEHGGEIAVTKSELGGALFTMRLPIRPPE